MYHVLSVILLVGEHSGFHIQAIVDSLANSIIVVTISQAHFHYFLIIFIFLRMSCMSSVSTYIVPSPSSTPSYFHIPSFYPKFTIFSLICIVAYTHVHTHTTYWGHLELLICTYPKWDDHLELDNLCDTSSLKNINSPSLFSGGIMWNFPLSD